MGMDLTRLSIALAAKPADRQKAEKFAYRAVARYAWTYGDLGGLKGALASGEIGAFQAVAWLGRAAMTFWRADFHLSWDWRDPRPALLLFAGKVPVLSRFARPRLAGLVGGAKDRDHGSPSRAGAISKRRPSWVCL